MYNNTDTIRESHKPEIQRGYKIWHEYMNYFTELKENCRFANLNESLLANFNFHARRGYPNEALLDSVNSTCFTGNDVIEVNRRLNEYSVEDRLHTMSLAFTNKEVDKINDDEFSKLVHMGAQCTIIKAVHTCDTSEINDDKKNELLRTHTKGYDVPTLYLAIGSRVRVTQNVCAQLGNEHVYYNT